MLGDCWTPGLEARKWRVERSQSVLLMRSLHRGRKAFCGMMGLRDLVRKSPNPELSPISCNSAWGGREARTRRCTIGSHGSPWTATTARDEVLRLSLLIAQDVDPVELEKQRRREAVDLAFDNYAERFERAYVGRGWKLLVARSLRTHTKPVLKSKPLPKITRAGIVAVFYRMPDTQVANRRNVFALLRRLFRWAVTCAEFFVDCRFCRRPRTALSRRCEAAHQTVFSLSRQALRAEAGVWLCSRRRSAARTASSLLEFRRASLTPRIERRSGYRGHRWREPR